MPGKNNKIKKLYIANRGEIALRIQKTATRLGITCCVGVSEADVAQSFTRQVDETVIIGPAPAPQSYLSIERVVLAAKERKCDAVHPGYGFLSENHEFAEAVIAAGMIWVGPSPESIRLMGSKIEGRQRAVEAKVPVVPGIQGIFSDQVLITEAKKIGFPLIIKAVGGGGGRGMRIIRSVDELRELLPRARGEALKNFGNDQIFLERFLEKPRHVEVQLLGDKYGQLIHLGTRDCSTQRRHQKLIEEAPAPFLTTAMREKIHRAALAVAHSVGYYSTGTAEFLVDGKDFYFLEMNTRIQVEHPVTESITGLDLIEQQLLVAQGEKLTLSQKKVRFSGHAVEFRINAEDPQNNFMPTAGEITQLKLPERQSNVRSDFGFFSGDSIGLFYDGLIGKIVVTGKTRKEALQRAVVALNHAVCEGLVTNLEFHRWLIRTRVFNQEGIDIAFVGREFDGDCLHDLAAATRQDPSLAISSEGEFVVARKDDLLIALPGARAPSSVALTERSDGLFIAERKKGKKSIRVSSNSRGTALRALLGE